MDHALGIDYLALMTGRDGTDFCDSTLNRAERRRVKRGKSLVSRNPPVIRATGINTNTHKKRD